MPSGTEGKVLEQRATGPLVLQLARHTVVDAYNAIIAGSRYICSVRAEVHSGQIILEGREG